jgi:hypothetical protein
MKIYSQNKMKNKELLNTKKVQTPSMSDKNKSSAKVENNSQGKSKKKDATTIEAKATKSMNQDSKK